MGEKLEGLRAKYGLGDGAKYEPNPECSFCRGAGERDTKRGLRFCICLYVAPEFSNLAGETLAATVKKLDGKAWPGPRRVDTGIVRRSARRTPSASGCGSALIAKPTLLSLHPDREQYEPGCADRQQRSADHVKGPGRGESVP
jgi:hypothetical protein